MSLLNKADDDVSISCHTCDTPVPDNAPSTTGAHGATPISLERQPPPKRPSLLKTLSSRIFDGLSSFSSLPWTTDESSSTTLGDIDDIGDSVFPERRERFAEKQPPLGLEKLFQVVVMDQDNNYNIPATTMTGNTKKDKTLDPKAPRRSVKSRRKGFSTREFWDEEGSNHVRDVAQARKEIEAEEASSSSSDIKATKAKRESSKKKLSQAVSSLRIIASKSKRKSSKKNPPQLDSEETHSTGKAKRKSSRKKTKPSKADEESTALPTKKKPILPSNTRRTYTKSSRPCTRNPSSDTLIATMPMPHKEQDPPRSFDARSLFASYLAPATLEAVGVRSPS